jgi:hypothetical protein
MTGEVPFKVQALSGDIPAKGGHSWFIPEKKGRSVLPLREGVSSHCGKECPPPRTVVEWKPPSKSKSDICVFLEAR